jgi:molybdenum cofactor biosynthesis enzyme MoaA
VASRSPFDPWRDSTAGRFVDLELWGEHRHVYANANLSIYSGQACNGGCGFCVEKLRPAARGVELASQKTVEADDARYFSALDEVLDALRPLGPSVSLTGGEPSLDSRLPRLLRTLQDRGMRKRTMTTNGSGLLDVREGRTVVDWVTATGVRHLNLSRALPADADNARLMQLDRAPDRAALAEIVARAVRGGTRPRLSCVLLRDGIADLDGVLEYLANAESLGVDNVVFRQLMTTEKRGPGSGVRGPAPTHPAADDHRPLRSQTEEVVGYSDAQRVLLRPLLAQLRGRRDFSLQTRVRGYYYEVEVWRWRGIDVVLEEASLAWLAASRQLWPELVFELVFHPSAVLCSTWQPWDGMLGPPPTHRGVRGPGSGVRLGGEAADMQSTTTGRPGGLDNARGSR